MYLIMGFNTVVEMLRTYKMSFDTETSLKAMYCYIPIIHANVAVYVILERIGCMYIRTINFIGMIIS